MNFLLELKKNILIHPVTSKQPHKIVQIHMGHPVTKKCYTKYVPPVKGQGHGLDIVDHEGEGLEHVGADDQDDQEQSLLPNYYLTTAF